ncbi:unnamed protein product [Ascophyllum nodosum]
MWSSRPLSDCRLEESGVWIDVPDTYVEMMMTNDFTSLISYSLVVVASKPQMHGSLLVGEQPPGGGVKDFLQVRLVVDGLPMRHSATYTSPVGSYESYVDTLGGHLVVELGGGNHSVGLQWKKSAHGVVTSWSNRPSSHDGFAGGRSIIVTAQHHFMWHSAGFTNARISETGTWEAVPELTLTFLLPELASIRVLYSISVMPEYIYLNEARQSAEYLTARLVVDGVAYRESIGTYTFLPHQISGGRLERDLVVNLQAGEHTVKVEWQKRGTYVRSWRNSPSFLDGFAMSRFVAAMGERYETISQHTLTPIVLRDPLDKWQTVGGKQLDFYLHGPATVLFTYGLPVTQYGHPSFDSWSWERWSLVQARLLIDGVPYRHSASQLDGSERTVGELRGLLAISLAGGSHTAAIQWKSESTEDSVPWYVLNKIAKWVFRGGEELLVLVNAENTHPQVIFPPGIYTVEEDDRLVISDVRITDIDVELATNYELAIRLSVDYGVVSLNDTEGLEFSFGDGVEDGVMSFHGPASSLGKALSCIIYRGNFNWFGNDTLTLTVNNHMDLGTGGGKSNTKQVLVTINVVSVPDAPKIVFPGRPSLVEDSTLTIYGMEVYDADVSRPGNERILFNIWLEVTSGRLSLNGSMGLMFSIGSGLTDRYVSFTGTLADINTAVGALTFIPDANFNSRQHAEVLTAGVWQVASEEAKVVELLPVDIYSINDPPEVVIPHHNMLRFGAFDVWSQWWWRTQGTVSTIKERVVIGIHANSASGRTILQGVNNGKVTLQQQLREVSYEMELVLSGSTEHLLNGLLHSDFAHVRIPGYDGVDSIQD